MIKCAVFVLSLLIMFAFLWWNREHPKVQEAIIATILTITGVIIFLFLSGGNKSVIKAISAVYFISNKENKPLFFTTPILTHYHLQQGIIYGEAGRNKTRIQESTKTIDNHRLFCDLQAATIMNHLFTNYSFKWFTKRVSEKFPGFTTVKGENLGDVKEDVRAYRKQDLKKKFSENEFFAFIYEFPQMSVPKGTIINYEPYNDAHKYCLIELHKPFYFDIKIKISFSSYIVGLGSVGQFTGISEDWYDKDYGTLIINVNCEGNFNKFISGNPSILKYKQWAENLFDDFYNTFDWQVCNSNIKEYLEVTAHQTIIKKVK